MCNRSHCLQGLNICSAVNCGDYIPNNRFKNRQFSISAPGTEDRERFQKLEKFEPYLLFLHSHGCLVAECEEKSGPEELTGRPPVCVTVGTGYYKTGNIFVELSSDMTMIMVTNY